MKLNIAYPPNGTQKLIELDDDAKLAAFYDQRIGAEVELEALGPEWKGYIAKITGGNDKQGFPMMQGVLTSDRVQLLLTKKHKCYRPRRRGERKRKSVRGCTIDSNLSVISLVIQARGPADIAGLTDTDKPKMRGPKRASKIRKYYNLDKKLDRVENYVIRNPKKSKYKGEVKTKQVGVKIQRLVTAKYVSRKKRMQKYVSRKKR